MKQRPATKQKNLASMIVMDYVKKVCDNGLCKEFNFMDMKEEILKILKNNSYKVDLLGTNEESIQATDGERIIDTEDIKTITDELIKLFSLHCVGKSFDDFEEPNVLND